MSAAVRSTHLGAARTDIPSLNGIRALAVGLVFLAHAGLERLVPGGLGVTAFFVLSGFLITTLMMEEQTRRGELDLGAFYLRRLLRLMPPLLLVLAVTALLAHAGLIDGEYSLGGFLAVLLYFGNYFVIAQDFNGVPAGIGVVWSLAVEEHYYLLYPWLALALLRLPGQRAAWLLTGLCVVVLAWRLVLALAHAPESYLIMASDTRLDAILAGCVLALGANPWSQTAPVLAPARERLLLAACLAALGLSLVIRDPIFRVTLRYTMQSAAVAGLLYLAVIRAQAPAFRWLNSRPLVYIGTVSYSIYLTHHVVLFALARHLPEIHGVVRALTAVLITLLLAELMRRYVEEPCAQLRRRLHQRRRLPRVIPAINPTEVTR